LVADLASRLSHQHPTPTARHREAEVRSAIVVLNTILLFCTIVSAQVAFDTPPTYIAATPQILSTPTALKTGASNATDGNVAGARNSTLEVLAGSLLHDGRIQEMPPVDPEMGFLTGNLGRVDTAYSVPAPSTRSLGDIARELHKIHRNGHVRLYTNDDVERVRRESRVYGTSDQGQPLRADKAPIPFTHSLAIREPVATDMVRQQPRETSAIVAVRTDIAEATTPASPQQTANPPKKDGQSSAPTANASSRRRLPAAGSILPLLAVLGTLLGMAGIITRRWTP